MKHPEPITIVCDTREQNELDFSPYEPFGILCERDHLQTGDYSIKGYQPFVMVERKSLQDCVQTMTHGRERFTREMYDRATFIPVRHMVVEASWSDISSPYKFSAANPLAIVNSLYSLMLPPICLHVFASSSRRLIAWYIVNLAVNFVRRAKHGSKGVWKSIWAEDSADLQPIPFPYREDRK